MDKIVFKVLLVLEFLLGCLVVVFDSKMVLLIAIGLIYLMIRLLPCCRKRECLWTFVLAIPLLLPINLFFYYGIRYRNLVEGLPKFLCLLEGMGEIAALLSLETMILMFVSKIIWKKQLPFGR